MKWIWCKERNGIAWLKAGVWKMRGIRGGFEKVRCPLCLEEEDILLN
jgi:hypothetical protein